MSAQVLELSRWNLTKFNEQLVAIVNKTTEFVHAILNVFMPTASQNKKSWIISKIASYGPLTRYYFQRLALPKERSPKKFDAFLWPSNKKSDDNTECVKFLCEYFVRCTAKGIDLLAKNEHLLPCFWDAFELIATIAMRSNQSNETNCHVNCLKYCCNAFFSVVQVIIRSSIIHVKNIFISFGIFVVEKVDLILHFYFIEIHASCGPIGCGASVNN